MLQREQEGRGSEVPDSSRYGFTTAHRNPCKLRVPPNVTPAIFDRASDRKVYKIISAISF
ncbi:MAG: hypothetical protein ACTSWP_04785 [Candidatus Freyarchaeota archaeon]|nr:hypothetical protein [Candidatus Freyrarchaeum guaymaensis]